MGKKSLNFTTKKIDKHSTIYSIHLKPLQRKYNKLFTLKSKIIDREIKKDAIT